MKKMQKIGFRLLYSFPRVWRSGAALYAQAAAPSSAAARPPSAATPN